MAIWDVWHDKCDQGVSGVDFGNIEFDSTQAVTQFFRARYPNGHIEDFGDEIHVYASADYGDDDEPIAGATYERA